MAIRNIMKQGEPVLNKKCKTIKEITPKTLEILEDLAETMYKFDGVGLAAPQVGILKRMVTIDVGSGLLELINPEILETRGSVTDVEGCLSVDDFVGEVTRPEYVKIRAVNRDGKAIEIEGHGLLARAFCHEIDHLNGVLFTEKVEREVK